MSKDPATKYLVVHMCTEMFNHEYTNKYSLIYIFLDKENIMIAGMKVIFYRFIISLQDRNSPNLNTNAIYFYQTQTISIKLENLKSVTADSSWLMVFQDFLEILNRMLQNF